MRKFATVAVFLSLGVSFWGAQNAAAQTYVQPSYEVIHSGAIVQAAPQPIVTQSYVQPISSYPTTSSYVSPVQSVTYSAPIQSAPIQSYPNSTGTVSRSYSSGGVSNVLAMLNSERARRGVYALSYDPSLQAVAERRAQQMASMGLKNHPPGSFAPGRYEGVGWSSSYSPSGVSACYTNSTSLRYAGAAMATGRDGVYFSVVYR